MLRAPSARVRDVLAAGLLFVLFLPLGAAGFTIVTEEATASAGVRGATDLTAASPRNADNPWGEPTVAVHVVHESGNSSHLDALARRELAHWEEYSLQYTGAEVAFELVDERESADLVIVFQAEVRCGPKRFAVGCTRTRTVKRTGTVLGATVWVRTGYDDPVVRHTLRHELGHVFGLDHGDAETFPFMRARIDPDSIDADALAGPSTPGEVGPRGHARGEGPAA